MLADLRFLISRLAFFSSTCAYSLTGSTIGAGIVSPARFPRRAGTKMLADLGFQVFRLAFFLSIDAYSLAGSTAGAGIVSPARFPRTAGT